MSWLIVIGGLAVLAVLMLVLFELLWRSGEDPTPDPQRLADFRALTLHEVRKTAEAFERDAQNTRGDAFTYELPALRWRQLERTLRKRGATQVGDLGARPTLRWAKRLRVLSDEPYSFTQS